MRTQEDAALLPGGYLCLPMHPDAHDSNLVEERLNRFGPRLTEGRRKLLSDLVSRRTRHFSMVLEDLKDPHNMSAVIRTCEVFGLQDVHIIEERNPYQVGRSVLKGSFKWLSLYRYPRRELCMRKLRERGYAIAVAHPRAPKALHELDFSRPTAFYLGSEVLGNHPDTLRQADFQFRIPQYGVTESMNVSVCGGIVIHTVARWLEQAGREAYALGPEEQKALLADFFERSVQGVDANSPIHFVREE